MKRTMIALALGGLVLGAGQILAQTKAHPGFEKLKSLVGVWEGKTSDGRAVKVSYQLISGGQGLMEILAAAEEDEMVTVYHPDGPRLRLTHYCSAGNQPRMQAEVPAGEIKNLKFSFIDATNMEDHAAGHIHSLAIAFDGKDQMTQVWIWRQDGHSAPMTFTLKRKK